MSERLAVLLEEAVQGSSATRFKDSAQKLGRPCGAFAARQTVSLTGDARRRVRHSGRAAPWLFRVASCLALALAAPCLPSQAPLELELDLRDGRKLLVERLLGDAGAGLRATRGDAAQPLALDDLVAVRVGSAAPPDLLRIDLVGGERMFGAIVGGDSNGDTVEVLSPVLGKRAVAIDRVEAVVRPGVHPGDQLVPEGIDEALFLPAQRGYDLVAGTLFRFGTQGLQFQAEGQERARWYSPRMFSSLRLRGGVGRDETAASTLWTRTADRLGVDVVRFGEDGVEVRLEGGALVTVRWSDVGCLVFNAGLRHLSEMQPTEVVERGFDGWPVHRWRGDRSAVGGELLARGRVYGRGLGVHSMSRLTYTAPVGATHFRASVALDDSVRLLPIRAHVEVRVLHNDREIFTAADLGVGQPVRDVGRHVVEAGDTITLEVAFGEGRDLGDRVDWLLPMFLMRRGS